MNSVEAMIGESDASNATAKGDGEAAIDGADLVEASAAWLMARKPGTISQEPQSRSNDAVHPEGSIHA